MAKRTDDLVAGLDPYEVALADVPLDLEQPVSIIELDQRVSSLTNTILRKLSSSRRPPTRWLGPALGLREPQMVQPFKWHHPEDEEVGKFLPMLVMGAPENVRLLGSILPTWFQVWATELEADDDARTRQADLDARAAVRVVGELWERGDLLKVDTKPAGQVIFEDDRTPSRVGYPVIPALLLRRLVGAQTRMVGREERLRWNLVAGRDRVYVVSQRLLSANEGWYSYRIDIRPELVSRTKGAVPVLHIALSQQRYPDGRINRVPENDYSVQARVRENLWLQVGRQHVERVFRREAAVGAETFPVMDDLPTLETLEANPEQYLDRMRIVFLEGMRFGDDEGGDGEDHPLEVGMQFGERGGVIGPVFEYLGLQVHSCFNLDQDVAKLLKWLGTRPGAKAIWSREKLGTSKTGRARRRQAIGECVSPLNDGTGLDVTILVQARHTGLVHETLPKVLEKEFGLEISGRDLEYLEVAPGFRIRVVWIPGEAADLFSPLARENVRGVNQNGREQYMSRLWWSEYQERQRQLAALLSEIVPEVNGVHYVIVDKPKPPFRDARWLDVKGAVRAALAEIGCLSQFLNPYDYKDEQEVPARGVVHRLSQSIYDGLRQTGVVLGPPRELYQELGLPPVHLIGMHIKSSPDGLRYPVFTRLTPEGEMQMRYPVMGGQLTPTWERIDLAMLGLYQHIWACGASVSVPGTFNKDTSPLYLSKDQIVKAILSALDDKEPSIVLAPAAVFRNRGIWPQLAVGNLGPSRDRLMLHGQLPIDRKNPAWKHIKGVARYRGPDRETPQYFPMDWTGRSVEHPAALGWIEEVDDELMRYLGVGITVVTDDNRERFHEPAHSLDHYEMRRPTSKKEDPEDFGAGRRYPHPRMVEWMSFFLSPDLGEDAQLKVNRLGHLSRLMGWWEPTLMRPWPAHIGKTVVDDALEIVARYEGY